MLLGFYPHEARSTVRTIGYPENPALAIFFPLWSLRL
jgi:hypothetical protein